MHWGMSHTEVTDVYNKLNGLFDREYAPLLAKLQPGVDMQQLEADRENLKESVFSIKHAAKFLYDAGDSMISLEQVRAVIDKPPAIVHGMTSAFCDFAGAGAWFLAPEPRHTGDNAGMIGFAAWLDPADAALYAGSGLRVDPAAYL